MKFKLLVLFAAGIIPGLFITNASAQETTQSSPPPTTSQPSTTPTQPSTLDEQGIRNYLLGPGDILDVRVFGQPDLSSTVQVDSDGNLSSLPFLETPIPAKCRTEKAVQKDISLAYSKFIHNPQVSVRITERNSHQPATVWGAVRQPTRVEMKRKVRLNEIMAVSGGITERAAGTVQILHTEPVMCPEPGEEALTKPISGAEIPFEIVKLADLRAGKPEANPVIRPGDYIIVTEALPVYVTGSVTNPTGVYLREGLTLSRVLAMVGGTRKEAKLSDVKIYRQKEDNKQEVIKVDYSAIRKNQKPDVLLEAYDVIDVPEAGVLSPQRLPNTLASAFSGGLSNVVGGALPSRIIY